MSQKDQSPETIALLQTRRLMQLLHCTNTDLAEAAGCDRSYISHIRSGRRALTPGSPAMRRLIEGFLQYAKSEDCFSLLESVCTDSEAFRENPGDALSRRLFQLPLIPMEGMHSPKRHRTRDLQAERRYGFGRKLDSVMEFLSLNNADLARTVNVDASLISRFRNGLRTPCSNRSMTERLAEALLQRADDLDLQELLFTHFGMNPGENEDSRNRQVRLIQWLCGNEVPPDTLSVDRLLESIDSFLPAPIPEEDASPLQKPVITPIYWGNEGLRDAVLRFLMQAADNGGELWLYSDEDMKWMTEDRLFFEQWTACMVNCLKNGVRLKIIHNTDRGAEEMFDAIRGWVPLYMSGLIEPYICKQTRDPRFSRTVFLHLGKACIHGNHTVNTDGEKWYDYLTDNRKLSAVEHDFRHLFSLSRPLLKIYVGPKGKELYRSLPVQTGKHVRCLTPGPSPGTLPESVVEHLESRSSDFSDSLLRDLCRQEIRRVLHDLKSGRLTEYFPLPAGCKTPATLSFGMQLCEIEPLMDESMQKEHLKSILRLSETFPDYRIVPLKEVPFPRIQIRLTDGEVTIFRCKPPYAAFVFTEPLLCRAMERYFDRLEDENAVQRTDLKDRIRILLTS